MSEKRRQKFPNISLYDWAKICDPKCKCNCDHVPWFTGVLVKPNWPPSEELSKSMLMIYSPGTWTSPELLKQNHPTFLEAFAEFLDSDICPIHLKQFMDEAKDKFDRKQLRNNIGPRNQSNDIASTQSSQSSQFSQSSDTVEYIVTISEENEVEYIYNY